MLFGGLEIVVGGVLLHRHHKKNNEKQRLRDEALQRRQNTFPGAKPPQSHPAPQQQPMAPPQKCAYYAPHFPPQPQPQPQAPQQFQYYHEPRPQLPPRPHRVQSAPYAPTYNIPRRPLPQQQPLLIQPLQRSDSMATISRMPIANGSRPHDVEDDPAPALPARPAQSNLQPPVNHPYSVSGFSVSVPNFGPAANAPLTYASDSARAGHTVDDNWETYGSPPSVHHDDENDPPPPYWP